MTIALSSLVVTANMNANPYVAAMNQKVAADKAGTASSVSVGNAVTQTDQKISKSGDVLSRLSRRYVEGFGSAATFRQELAALSKGLETGKIHMAQADAILTGMNAKFGLTANATDLAEQGYVSLSQAVASFNARLSTQVAVADRATAATLKLGAANNNFAGRGQGQFQTANLAAQFQDIGVTAAMGMSPMMIALQQGTQISAVLGPMGATGAVKGLAAAFLSIINPVSLATIAFVGLTAAAIQYFMRSEDESKSVDEALKAHESSIRALKGAYGEAASGLEEYAQKSRVVLEAQNIISGARIRDELEKFTASLVDGGRLLTTEAERIKGDIDRISQAMVFKSGDPEAYDELSRQLDGLMGQLAKSENIALVATDQFGLLKVEIDAFAVSVKAGAPDYVRLQEAIARGLVADPTNQDLIRLARSVDELIAGGIRLQSAMDTSASAIGRIGSTAADQVKAVKDLAAALNTLAGVSLPALNGADQARAAFEKGMAAAGTDPRERRRLEDAYSAAMERYQTSFIPTPTARPNIEMEGLPKVAGAGRQPKVSDFDREIERIRERTAALEAETNVIGLSTFAAERYLATQRLEAAAREDAIGLTETRVAAIDKEAAAYARQVAATEKAIEAQKRLDEETRFHRDLLGGALSDLRSALEDGKLSWQEMGDIAVNALDKIIDRIQDQLLDAIFEVNKAAGSGGGGGGILGFLGGLFGGGGGGLFGTALNNTTNFTPGLGGGFAGMLGMAKGGAFAGGSVTPFAQGGVVDRPTLFHFAKGAGLMGEAGPEAIMPLRRDSQGRLGVTVGNTGAAQPAASNQNSRVVIELAPGLVASILEQSGSQTVSIVQANNSAQDERYQNGAAR